jgi:probable rRNA maturation factor
VNYRRRPVASNRAWSAGFRRPLAREVSGRTNVAAPSLRIELTNRQSRWPVDATGLVRAVECVLAAEGPANCQVHLAVVDDAEIHHINRQFLAHDEPTDVITFVLEQDQQRLEGEIIVSADTAARLAADVGWPLEHELTLYSLHGALHLVGYDDLDPDSAQVMRTKEAHYLQLLGIDPAAAGRF